jgi:hypothetical protein
MVFGEVPGVLGEVFGLVWRNGLRFGRGFSRWFYRAGHPIHVSVREQRGKLLLRVVAEFCAVS